MGLSMALSVRADARGGERGQLMVRDGGGTSNRFSRWRDTFGVALFDILQLKKGLIMVPQGVCTGAEFGTRSAELPGGLVGVRWGELG